MLVVTAAFIISLLKMGVHARVRQWLVAANAALTGPDHSPP
jgi:hypothetical protein